MAGAGFAGRMGQGRTTSQFDVRCVRRSSCSSFPPRIGRSGEEGHRVCLLCSTLDVNPRGLTPVRFDHRGGSLWIQEFVC